MSSETRMPLVRAQAIAERFIKLIAPACSKYSIAGSVRRECPDVGDVEIVALAKDDLAMSQILPEGFPGMVVNGARLKRFKYPEHGIQVELYLPQPHDYGRILAIRTGSSAFAHHLMIEANRKGWIGTADGLRRKKECEKKGNVWKIKPEYKTNPTLPPIFDTEMKFFEFIGVTYVEPCRRSWVSKNNEYNYAL